MYQAWLRCTSVLMGIISIAGGYGAEADPLERGLPQYDAAAMVKVRFMDHSLLASDVRRVEQGAPVPLVPYKGQLDVRMVCPEVKAYRVLLEGITETCWMPEKDETGIVLLRHDGKEYVPAGTFPASGYYPIDSGNAEETAAFPPGADGRIPLNLVWQCLCDIQAARTGALSAEALQQWTRRFQEENGASALVALFFLITAPDQEPGWEQILNRMRPVGNATPSVTPLPALESVQVIAAHGSDALATALLAGVNDYIAAIPLEKTNALAEQLAGLVGRLVGEARIEALNRLLLAARNPETPDTRIIYALEQIAPVLSAAQDAPMNQFLETMLREPWRFPCIKERADLARLWQIMADRRHPALAAYLTEFNKRPTPEFLRMPINPLDLEQLINLANQLLTAMRNDDAS